MKLLTPEQLAEIDKRINDVDGCSHYGVLYIACTLREHITALETTKQGLERRETEFLLPSINDLQTTITALEDEKAELVKHATHLPLCDRNSTGIDSRQLFCTCGLDELLSKQEQE